jgi:dynein heavy chain
MNLPKFVYDDVPLFLGLINDLFPGLECPRVRYPLLNDVLEADFAEHHYQVRGGCPHCSLYVPSMFPGCSRDIP